MERNQKDRRNERVRKGKDQSKDRLMEMWRGRKRGRVKKNQETKTEAKPIPTKKAKDQKPKTTENKSKTG